MDLAQLSPEYLRGAGRAPRRRPPEGRAGAHRPDVLDLMKKPDIDNFEGVRRASSRRRREQAGKPKQYLVPYFIASHPGSRPARDDRPGRCS